MTPEQIRRKLARIGKIPAAVRSKLAEEVDAIADEHVAAMKRIVPKDEHDLEQSIGKVAGPGRTGEIGVEVTAGGPSAPHVAKVEFGHKAVDGSEVPAVPFFYPVKRAKSRDTKRRLGKAVREGAKSTRGGA